MAECKRLIEDWLAGGCLNLAGLYSTDGISRKTGRKWVQWFTSEG